MEKGIWSGLSSGLRVEEKPLSILIANLDNRAWFWVIFQAHPERGPEWNVWGEGGTSGQPMCFELAILLTEAVWNQDWEAAANCHVVAIFHVPWGQGLWLSFYLRGFKLDAQKNLPTLIIVGSRHHCGCRILLSAQIWRKYRKKSFTHIGYQLSIIEVENS